jgi:hypothetical protein
MLRSLGSRVYLLALPIEFFGNEFETFYPGGPRHDAGYKPYALWICMNGKPEAEKKMIKHNMTAIDNQVRLHSCGFLTPKK